VVYSWLAYHNLRVEKIYCLLSVLAMLVPVAAQGEMLRISCSARRAEDPGYRNAAQSQ